MGKREEVAVQRLSADDAAEKIAELSRLHSRSGKDRRTR
jgi:hypothetical protein